MKYIGFILVTMLMSSDSAETFLSVTSYLYFALHMGTIGWVSNNVA